MIDHGALMAGLVETVSTSAIVPVFCTVKVNGALPGTELMIVGAVYTKDFPSGVTLPMLGSTILQLNVPTLIFWTAETESVNWALTPPPIRPTARANPAASPAIFRRDIVPSSCFRVCGESPGCAK